MRGRSGHGRIAAYPECQVPRTFPFGAVVAPIQRCRSDHDDLPHLHLTRDRAVARQVHSTVETLHPASYRSPRGPYRPAYRPYYYDNCDYYYRPSTNFSFSYGRYYR